jgi:hypothetical protein
VLKGTVVFTARVLGNRLSFPKLELTPIDPAIGKIELETNKDASEIQATAHFESIDTADHAEAIAANAVTSILDRLAFDRGLAIGTSRRTHRTFQSLEPNTLAADLAEVSLVGEALTCCIGLNGAGVNSLKKQLEQTSLPGERLFGVYRAARQSKNPVEEFLHLYNLLLMLRNDRQAGVDAFIRRELPSVPQTSRPDKPHINETIYTRLRNELAHPRVGVNLERTKSEMSERVAELAGLTRRAIQKFA